MRWSLPDALAGLLASQAAAAVAVPLLCGAVDQAVQLQRVSTGGVPQRVQAFEAVVQTVYRGVCAAAAPSIADSPELFEV